MKHRRILLLFVVFVSVLIGATYLFVTTSGASRSVIEALLSRMIRGLSLHDAEVDPTTGRVSLRGVRILDPRRPDATLLHAQRIEVDVGTNPLDQVGAIRRVRVQDLELEVDLAAGESLDLRRILKLENFGGGTGEEALPVIQIVDATLRIRLVAGSDPLEFHDVDLELMPEEGSSRRVVLQGTLRSRLGYEARISGTGDLRTEDLRIVLDARAVPLSAALVHSFAPTAERWLADAGFRGVADKLAVWIEHTPMRAGADDAGFAAGIGIDFRDVALRTTEFDYPLESIHGRVSATTREHGTVTFELARDVDGSRLSGSGSVTHIQTDSPRILARLAAREVAVDATLARAVRSRPEARPYWDAFEPADGKASATLQLKNDGANGSRRLRFAMDLDLDGVSGTFRGIPRSDGTYSAGFPYRLTGVTGQVQVRPDGRVAVHRLNGRDASGGSVDVQAEFAREDADGRRPFRVDVSARDIAFSDELRAGLATLLPEQGGATYDEYAPTGRLDVDVRVEDGDTPREPRFEVSLRPIGATATFAGFPCRVDDVRGTVTVNPDGVLLALTGKRATSAVQLDGRFLHRSGAPRLRSELWVRAEPIGLDAELRNALVTLDPALGRVLDYLSPNGAAAVDACLWRDAGVDDFTYDVRLDLDGAGVLLKDFRLPLTDLTGQVFVHGTGAASAIEVAAVRGKLANDAGTAPADLMIQGTVTNDVGDQSAPPVLRFDVTTIVQELQLNRGLAEELAAQGMIELDAWDVLKPSGHVDLVARQVDAGSGIPEHLMRLRMRDVGSDAAVLPAPARGMRGELVVRDRQVRFEELSGRVGTAEVAVHGGSVVRAAHATVFAFDVGSESFPVDANLANLMTGPLRRAYLDRNVRGHVRVPKLSVRIEFPADGSEFTTTFSGQFLSRDVALNLAAPVERVQGLLEITEGVVGPAGGTIRGSASDVTFRVAGHEITAFAATFAADPEKVDFTDASMRLHGGSVRGPRHVAGADTRPTLRYEYAGPGTLTCDLDWDGVSLGEFLRAAGQTTPRLQGTLGGELRIDRLIGEDLVDIQASGKLRIDNGFLGEVPLFSAIFSTLEPSQRPRFDGVQLEVEVRDRVARIREFVITSSLLEITGEGQLTLDGYVDMVFAFPNLFGSASEVLLLPRLLTMLTSQVVRFHVYGYLRDVQSRSRLMWQQDPGRRGILPLPPVVEPTPIRRF